MLSNTKCKHICFTQIFIGDLNSSKSNLSMVVLRPPIPDPSCFPHPSHTIKIWSNFATCSNFDPTIPKSLMAPKCASKTFGSHWSRTQRIQLHRKVPIAQSPYSKKIIHGAALHGPQVTQGQFVKS